MADRTTRAAQVVKQRKAIPFHRRAQQAAANARRIDEATKIAEGYRAFNDPERYRIAVLRSLDMVRGLVQSGNRHFTEAGEAPTLRMLGRDSARTIEALARVETILKAAKIVDCRAHTQED